jgi:hypothetical protein
MLGAPLAHWLLSGSVATILFLTFVWPFLISSDPADARFRIAAIAAFVVFLFTVAALAVVRLKRN